MTDDTHVEEAVQPVTFRNVSLSDEVYLASAVDRKLDEFEPKTDSVPVRMVTRERYDEIADSDEKDETAVYVVADDDVWMYGHQIHDLYPATHLFDAVNLEQLSTDYVSKYDLWKALSSATDFDSFRSQISGLLVGAIAGAYEEEG